MRAVDAGATPWQAGPFRQRRPGLFFGSMYEDAAIELQAFAPHSRAFCIAAAGCTARALAAAGHRVTAVDINPQQIAYAQARSLGQAPQEGSVERLMAHGRRIVALCGWTRTRLEAFLSLSDTAEQLLYWDQHLDTRRLRLLLDTLLAPRMLALRYSTDMLQTLPQDFGKQVRERLRRGWAQHSNSSNPYAASLLLGTPPLEYGEASSPIHFACAEAAEYLERCSPGSFDAFSLSNISDGTPRSYRTRLRAAIERAAAPNAVVVTRSFAEENTDKSACIGMNWARLDRSLLWDAVRIKRLEGGDVCAIS